MLLLRQFFLKSICIAVTYHDLRRTCSERKKPLKDDYEKSVSEIDQIVLTIIVFICVGSSWSFGVHGAGGWINFTAALSLIFSVFFFIIFLFNFIHRLPGPWVLIDFVVQAVLCFLMTISLIVAAASSHYGGSAISAAIFCAILAVTYAVECAIRFSIYRQNNQLIVSTKGVTSTGPNFQAAGADHTVPQTGPGLDCAFLARCAPELVTRGLLSFLDS
ncbi:unnamed protein product [Schistocephalus solidus]|uniref:MARVEL domain-containing protein n=1 Tax=Schistocephalus solidus TaxID=70667 RepID=A0A183SWF5_SCHSO|nr:unnamed protein product [Schistocephalus solidus]